MEGDHQRQIEKIRGYGRDTGPGKRKKRGEPTKETARKTGGLGGAG